jgi:chlorobactene glucosyltransferase
VYDPRPDGPRHRGGLRAASRANPTASPGVVALRALIHLCAAAALAYVLRIERYRGGWTPIPIETDLSNLPSLSIVVPARNEAENIERCVRSLAAQRLPDFEIIAIDDHSTDETPEILARLASGEPRLRIVCGGPLPEGWIGKPWALHQGGSQARGEWLLFTDADTAHAPGAAASTLRYAIEHGLDALSLATGQELGSFWERAVLPSILAIVLFAFGTLEELNDPARPDRALANGQYILVRRGAYDALGGHAALRSEMVEDLEFARRLKRDGRFRLGMVNGSHLVRVRMYRSFARIWEGFTKNVFAGNDRSVSRSLASSATLSLLSIVPPVLAVTALRRGDRRAAIEALCCTAATMTATARSFRWFGLPPRYAAYQPLGFATLAAITLNSTFRVIAGFGVTWRGRRYTGR